MNQMNLNERVLPHGESICFVGKFDLIFRLLSAVSTILNKTNASAAPKIQFIEVHLLHSVMITRTLLYKLMNLMNFNELRYYLRLLFAMDKRARHVFWLGQVHQGSFGSLKKVMTMRKIFFLLSALVLTGCGSPLAMQAVALGTPEAQRSATPVATATITITPSPTVDWKGTAIVAQATADEARRLDTQATAAEKDRIQQQLAWTAEANQWTAQANQWTATAALTSIPLTSTQQSVVNTQVPIDQALMAGQLTATKEAPTQIVAMIDAKNYETYGATDYVVRLFVLGALGVFLLGIGLFALSARTKEEVKPRSAVPSQAVREPDLIPLKPELMNSRPTARANPNEVSVSVVKDNGGGNIAIENYRVPCSEEQLTELALRVLDEGETLGVNNWEGDGTELTRAVIYRLRNWFQGKQMVNSIGSGRLKFNERGLELLQTWKEKKVLPHPYVFAPVVDLPLNMSHEAGAHVPAHGGGA